MLGGTSHIQRCVPDDNSSMYRCTRNPGCSMKYADKNPPMAWTTQGAHGIAVADSKLNHLYGLLLIHR